MKTLNDREVPVFLMTGFLESGKTDFLKYTMEQDYFQVEGTTLLILCEEGELEYEEEYLEANRIVMEVLEEQDELTSEKLQELEEKYRPEQVVIEYNGMWPMSQIHSCKSPKGWEVSQQVTMVDASTFQLYMNNMKSLFMDMARDSDLIIFNRSSMDMPLDNYRRSIAIVNPQATIVFEDMDGEQIEDIYDGKMPFDVTAPIIDVEPIDYGMLYMDMSENQERYNGKTVRFQAKAKKSPRLGSKVIVAGRTAMTCCDDDTVFMGYVVMCPSRDKVNNGDWVDITAEVKFEYTPHYRKVGPVLYEKELKVIEPLENEMVYFM
jgi:uncharacterized membrane protein YcgQ (UPF0703/DUF1980 family)